MRARIFHHVDDDDDDDDEGSGDGVSVKINHRSEYVSQIRKPVLIFFL